MTSKDQFGAKSTITTSRGPVTFYRLTRLEEIGVTHHGQKITAHASLGAEPYGAHDNALDLIRRADMAMYYNKLRRHIGLMQSAAE